MVALSFISWSFCLTFTGVKLIQFHLSSIEYADDQIIFTMSPEELQDFLSATAAPFGLRLAPQKCELICFHRIGTIDKSQLPVIKLGGHSKMTSPPKWHFLTLPPSLVIVCH